MSTFKPQYKDKNGVVRDLNIDYNSLANKPTIGQGTLTIQKNGSNVATFGANSTSNVTANISVPTTIEGLSGNLSTYRLYEPSLVNGVTPTSQGVIDITSADRLTFLPADQIIIEQSTDGGTTWVSGGYNDTQKRQLFSGLENGNLTIPRNSSGKKSCNCMVRVTITGMKYNVPNGTAETNKYNYWNSTYVKSGERYFNPNLCTLWLNSNADRIQTTVLMATGANPNSWVTNRVVNGCYGWYGRSTISLGGSNFGGSTGQTGNYWNYRFIFRTQAIDGSFDDSKLSTSYSTHSQNIYGIRLYSSNAWTIPSNMARNGHLYTWDIDQNAIFPSLVKAPIFYEGGTSLVNKYLGISAKAADSSKLNGQSASYYATKTEATTASKKTSSANSTSKLFLIGATSQSADASTTYSNSKCYVGTDNCLYSNSTKVLTSHEYRPIQINGASILTNTSSAALNFKAGTNISLSGSNGTITIDSTASGGGGGMTSTQIFYGAGETSGSYTETIRAGNYEMLLFEIDVNDVNFYLALPTGNITSMSSYHYLAAGNTNNGAMGIVSLGVSNTNFSASVSNGNIIVYNVNVYAYK